MTPMLMCIAIAVALFAAAFLSKRRFGILGLALATGSVLSDVWGAESNTIAAALNLQQSSIIIAIIRAAILLLPAGLILLRGASYKSTINRVVGSSLFTVLSLAFLIEPLGHFVALGGQEANLYDILKSSRELIIGSCLIVAIIDVFISRSSNARQR